MDFFKRFPEEKQGRKNFKNKEIQNVKLLIYEKIIKKGYKIKADCVGNIKEKTLTKNMQIFPIKILLHLLLPKKIITLQ